MNILGIDIGGTKVALGIINEEGSLLHQTRYPHRKCPTEEWLCELFEKTDAFLSENGMMQDISAIGIGARGHVDYKKQILVSATNMMLTEPFDLCTPLKERYHCPVFIDNDAKSAAALELCFGKGKDLDNFVCYNIGTGIGSCVVMNRSVLRGDLNFAGEIGYDFLCADLKSGMQPQASPALYLENLAGGAGLRSGYLNAVPESERKSAEESLSSHSLFELANAGDSNAGEIIGKAVRLIGTSIYNLHNLLDISHFIFAGGVTGQASFMDAIYRYASELIDRRPGPKELFFAINSAGSDDAGVIGAACVALNEWKNKLERN